MTCNKVLWLIKLTTAFRLRIHHSFSFCPLFHITLFPATRVSPSPSWICSHTIIYASSHNDHPSRFPIQRPPSCWEKLSRKCCTCLCRPAAFVRGQPPLLNGFTFKPYLMELGTLITICPSITLVQQTGLEEALTHIT